MPRISRRSPRNPPSTQAADSSSRVARPRPPRRGRGPSGRGRSGSQAQASQPLDDHVLSAIRAEIQAALRGTPQPGSTSPGSTSGDASGDAQPSSSENAGDIAPLGSLPLPAAITSVAVTSPNPAVTTDSRTGGTGQNVLSVITPSTNSNLAPSSQQPTGIILSPALQPIPARLVRRIQEGEFLEMRELLADNIALHDQLEAIQGPVITQATPGSLRPRLREIPSITSWMYCFAAYVAVRTTDPATRQMLAYARLIIREALHHGGSGWQDYDRCFRQQAAIDRSLPWNVLLPGLQSATILGQRTPGGAHCSLCRGVEHTATQCALTCMQQQPGQAFFTPLASRRQVQLRQRDGRLQDRICGSWNSGSCIYPRTCSYRHVCATCHQNHRARDCPDRPEGSRHRPGQPGTSQGSNTSGRNQTSRAT